MASARSSAARAPAIAGGPAKLAWATKALASSLRAPTSARIPPHAPSGARRQIVRAQGLAEEPLGHALEVPVAELAGVPVPPRPPRAPAPSPGRR